MNRWKYAVVIEKYPVMFVTMLCLLSVPMIFMINHEFICHSCGFVTYSVSRSHIGCNTICPLFSDQNLCIKCQGTNYVELLFLLEIYFLGIPEKTCISVKRMHFANSVPKLYMWNTNICGILGGGNWNDMKFFSKGRICSLVFAVWLAVFWPPTGLMDNQDLLSFWGNEHRITSE